MDKPKGRPKKPRPDRVCIDVANAFEFPGAETRISVDDVFKHGGWNSVKDHWDMMAAKLEAGIELHEFERKYLVRALREMCDSGNADAAFGVTRKGIEPQYVRSVLYLVNDLRRQGVSSKDAWEKINGLDLIRNVIRRNNGGDALRKKYKDMRGNFGRITRTNLSLKTVHQKPITIRHAATIPTTLGGS